MLSPVIKPIISYLDPLGIQSLLSAYGLFNPFLNKPILFSPLVVVLEKMIGLRKKKEEEDRQKREEEEEEEAHQANRAHPTEDPTVSSALQEGGSSRNTKTGDLGADLTEAHAEELEIGKSGGRGRGRGSGVSFLGIKRSGGRKTATNRRKLAPGELRVQKDISELDGGDCAVADFPDPNNLMNFYVVVSPDEGYWKGYSYRFQFVVPDLYPHEPPKVKCLDKIYHPNIDTEGNVCLNILRSDWKPVLDINSVIYGLIVLFVQPNPDDPLNLEAAKTLREQRSTFRRNVEKYVFLQLLLFFAL